MENKDKSNNDAKKLNEEISKSAEKLNKMSQDRMNQMAARTSGYGDEFDEEEAQRLDEEEEREYRKFIDNLQKQKQNLLDMLRADEDFDDDDDDDFADIPGLDTKKVNNNQIAAAPTASTSSSKSSAAKSTSKSGTRSSTSSSKSTTLKSKKSSSSSKASASEKIDPPFVYAFHTRGEIAFKVISIVLCVIVFLGAIGGFAYWITSERIESRINYIVEEIELLPSEVAEYSYYEEKITELNQKYNKLSKNQKKRVKNAEKLSSLVDGLNQNTIAKLRSLIAAITPSTVETTNNLQDAVELNKKLTSDQRAMLTDEEKSKLKTLGVVYEIIETINGLSEEETEQRDAAQIESLKEKYDALDEEFKELVYNYDVLATFEEPNSFWVGVGNALPVLNLIRI